VSDPARSSRPDFRSDINGLRAWAVVAVVLYHFGVPGIQGGFVGVDVFFVISGFLMTGIIVNGLERSLWGGKSFSLLDFYLARARRIVPALAVLCAVLLVLAWFVLPVADYRQLGIHVAFALAFLSNLKFWHEAGYFDVASHEKWLLHTWSLSAEWQFYLILPLVLMLLWRLWPSRRAVVVCLLVGFFASFAFSIFLTSREPAAAFYLLPTRAWEMFAGGLVFMLADRLKLGDVMCRILELIGFALILRSIAFSDPGMQWPGWRALLPVVGAMLVLSAARTGSLWTGTSVAQWLGNASYSIYLWHWPVVVGLAYADLLDEPAAMVVGLLASCLLGHLSCRWVEHSSRQRLAAWSWKHNVFAISSMAGLVALAGSVVYLRNGLEGRIDPHIAAIFAEAGNRNPRSVECHKEFRDKVPECMYGGQQLGGIVIGDSHAASVIRTVEKSLPIDFHVLDWTYSACATLKNVRFKDPRGDRCGEFVSQALGKSKSLDIVPLLIVNRSSVYIRGSNDSGQEIDFDKIDIYFENKIYGQGAEIMKQWRKVFIDTACEFASKRPVYMMRPIPELHSDVPRTMGRAALLGLDRRVSISLEEYHDRHHLVWEAQDAARAQCGIHILDPLPYLCSEGRCWGDKDACRFITTKTT